MRWLILTLTTWADFPVSTILARNRGISGKLSLPFVAIATLLVLPLAAQADCQQQLQQLSTDLHGIALSETQKQTIGGMVDDARRYCWVHREEPAMEIIAKARQTAGIKPPGEEFDWETVPLDSLERR